MAQCKRMVGNIRFIWFFGLGLGLLNCTTEQVVEPETPKPTPRIVTGSPISFGYPTLDGQMLSTSSIAGRYTVLSFITTYDHFSHAQARFLSTVINKHVPRINAGLIVLEPPQNKVLVEAFVKVVAPPYPVAMADEATIRGEGPFLDLHEVPSTVILDPSGREVWRHKGLASNDMIDLALNAVRAGKTPPGQ
jgi:hypothetical protein